MNEFKLGGRELLLPKDAVLEWFISEPSTFNPTGRLPGAGLDCAHEWHDHKVYVYYLEVKLWVSHANIRKTIEISFVIAFETAHEISFEDEDEKSRSGGLREQVKEAIICGFDTTKDLRPEYIARLVELRTPKFPKPPWAVNSYTDQQYMTSYD